jgi:hypothetical protein
MSLKMSVSRLERRSASRLADRPQRGTFKAPGPIVPEVPPASWTMWHAQRRCEMPHYLRARTTIMKDPGLAVGRPDAPGFCSSNSAVGR